MHTIKLAVHTYGLFFRIFSVHTSLLFKLKTNAHKSHHNLFKYLIVINYSKFEI